MKSAYWSDVEVYCDITFGWRFNRLENVTLFAWFVNEPYEEKTPSCQLSSYALMSEYSDYGSVNVLRGTTTTSLMHGVCDNVCEKCSKTTMTSAKEVSNDAASVILKLKSISSSKQKQRMELKKFDNITWFIQSLTKYFQYFYFSV